MVRNWVVTGFSVKPTTGTITPCREWFQKVFPMEGIQGKGCRMLTDIIIGRSALGSNRADMHRSASFSCTLGAWSRRIAKFLGTNR